MQVTSTLSALRLVLAAFLLVSCVSGTAYQRAMLLQSDNPSNEEIMHSFTDPSWKLRCLAARACAARPDEQCLDSTERLVLDLATAPCAFESLTRACDRGGRKRLGAAIEGTGLKTTEPLVDALASCPSADGVLALATKLARTGGDTTDAGAFSRLGLGPMPQNQEQLPNWFVQVLKFPEPSVIAKKQLQAIQTLVKEQKERTKRHQLEARHQQEERDRASALHAEQERSREGHKHLASAREALHAYDIDAAAEETRRAEALGIDVSEIRKEIRRTAGSPGAKRVERCHAARKDAASLWSTLATKADKVQQDLFQSAGQMGGGPLVTGTVGMATKFAALSQVSSRAADSALHGGGNARDAVAGAAEALQEDLVRASIYGPMLVEAVHASERATQQCGEAPLALSRETERALALTERGNPDIKRKAQEQYQREEREGR